MQVTKIGRDAVLYVESLIESIMGGLEGLINILDSEGGFGALEIQVINCFVFIIREQQSLCSSYFDFFIYFVESQLLPEQAASYMNYASRVSMASTKSPKGAGGYPLPGHESHPESNNSIKM